MADTSYDSTIKPQHFAKLARYHALCKLRGYYTSSQYEGRPDFFTGQRSPGDKPVPLRERKPCVIYPLARNAVHQVVRFTFGESRFPTIAVEAVEKPEDAVYGLTLSDDDSETLEKYIAKCIETSALKPTMRRLMRPGLAVGTAVAILVVRNGCFRIDIANAEDCMPTFKGGDVNGDVTALTWCYQFNKTVPNPQTGIPEVQRTWYRQDITEAAHLIYREVAVQAGVEPIWTVAKTIPHNLGFCPVRWIRNLHEEDSGSVDGASLYEDLFDEFDALNFALSQRHRGIHHFGTPQPWETGVDEDDGPGATGRKSVGTPGFSPGGGSPHGRILGADGTPARKGGPDQVWSFTSKEVKLGVLETTGKAFEVSTLHVNDIRARVLESMSVVLVNVSEIAGRTQQGQMSAKFLELAYEPLLAVVDEMRHCWWPLGLQPILSMMLRATVALAGKDLMIPGAEGAARILKKFLTATTAGPMWVPPTMTPNWGDYFAAGPEEINQAITAAKTANEAHLVPAEDAVKYVLPYFGREDVQEALDEIEDDKAEAQAQAQETAMNEAAALHAAGGIKPPGGAGAPKPTERTSKARRRGKPAKDAAGRGGGAGAPSRETSKGG